MDLKGKVVCGFGEGRKFFSLYAYSDGFEKLLGEKPFFGTLNLEVEEREMSIVERLKFGADLLVSGFKFEGKEYFDVRCIRAKLNGISGLLVFPKINHHPKNVLEFVCSENLREEFGLKDGETVKLEI